MSNLSNELGISKNRKIEILLEMGYVQNQAMKNMGAEVWTPKSSELSISSTKSYINGNDLGYFETESSFIDFIKNKQLKK